MDFIKNAISFTAGMLAQLLVIQGNIWAGIAVYLTTVGIILVSQMPRKN